MREDALNAIVNAGASGVEQSSLFAGKQGGNGAVNLTNALAQLRRDGSVVLRREMRDGVKVGVYYSAANAPSSPQPEGAN